MAGGRWWQRGTPGVVAPEGGERPAVDAGDGADPVTEVLVRDARLGSRTGQEDAQPTARLEPLAAAAVADPGALTQVLALGQGPSVAPGQASGPSATMGPPLLGRRAAAELGVYVGAALVVLAAGGVALRGWADWDDTMRALAVALTSLALLATGLFVRLPWGRRPGPERRRAVSALLTAGMALVLAATGLGLNVRQGSGGSALLHAVGSVLAMLLVAVVARTPLSETGVLLAACWAAWLLVPTGSWTWVALAGLGLAWAAAGARLARGRRTAVVSGAAVALVGAVGMAQGPLAWWVRGALVAVALAGLLAFLRGRANAWLALGAAAATALAASVAGGQLGPAPALLVGGLATMAVSAIALRSARRTS